MSFVCFSLCIGIFRLASQQDGCLSSKLYMFILPHLYKREHCREGSTWVSQKLHRKDSLFLVSNWLLCPSSNQMLFPEGQHYCFGFAQLRQTPRASECKEGNVAGCKLALVLIIPVEIHGMNSVYLDIVENKKSFIMDRSFVFKRKNFDLEKSVTNFAVLFEVCFYFLYVCLCVCMFVCV